MLWVYIFVTLYVVVCVILQHYMLWCVIGTMVSGARLRTHPCGQAGGQPPARKQERRGGNSLVRCEFLLGFNLGERGGE